MSAEIITLRAIALKLGEEVAGDRLSKQRS